MSSQVYASRSHHNLRSQYSASSSRNPSHGGEAPRYDEYGHRQPGGNPRQPRADPGKSLRSVASSSRLPRQVYREEMPPPPVPSPRKRLPPAPSSSEQHSSHRSYPSQQTSIPYTPPAASTRIETFDSIPSHSTCRPNPPLKEQNLSHRQYQSAGSNDHQAVLDRMRQNGWHGVGGGRTGSTDGMSQRSTSSSSISSSGRGGEAHSTSLSKVDSGYSEEIDGEDKTAGEKVLEGWSALKKAVAGLAGAQIWNRLTTTIATSVGTVQDAWNTEDDESIGPDGETKLGRAIKSYHLSRVESVEDVPEWLLNDAERASYHRRKLSHTRSTQEFDRPSAPQSMRERPVARQYHSEEQLPVRRAGSENNASRGSEAQPPNFAGIGGVGRGSAADRLARMREERRMRATAISLVSLIAGIALHDSLTTTFTTPNMKLSTLAGLALLASSVRGGNNPGEQGRNSSPKKMRHVVRSPSPWGDYEPSRSPSSGYDSCVQQCMAGYGSWGMGGGDQAAPQAGYSSSHDSTSPATPTSNVYGSPPPLVNSGSGAYGAVPEASSMMSMAPVVASGGSSNSTGNSSVNTNGTSPDGLVAGPYQVIVAPKKGDLRMVPFNINVPQGQNVTFLWGAGPHTVTQSSPLEICNASQTAGAYKSGMQDVGFQFPVQISSNSTQTYFCGVPNHCQKGMFGLINGLTVAVPEGSFGQAMPQMAANDSGLMSLWNETKTMCKDSPSAWSWGDSLATTQFPEWALPMAMENILMTRQFLVSNPEGISNSSTVATRPSSPISTGGAGSASPSQSPSDSLTGSSSTFSINKLLFTLVLSALSTFFVMS
ncbi:hypothetical protein JCM5350_003671 [Sporobolomyces pararoseus]